MNAYSGHVRCLIGPGWCPAVRFGAWAVRIPGHRIGGAPPYDSNCRHAPVDAPLPSTTEAIQYSSVQNAYRGVHDGSNSQGAPQGI